MACTVVSCINPISCKPVFEYKRDYQDTCTCTLSAHKHISLVLVLTHIEIPGSNRSLMCIEA